MFFTVLASRCGARNRRDTMRDRIPKKAAFPTIVALALTALQLAPAAVVETLPELRIATAYGSEADVNVFTAAWFGKAPQWTRANRLEFAAGIIHDSEVIRPFAFVGPVWRLDGGSRSPFVELSFGPTVLGGATVGGRDLGGNLHFRSALALGKAFGRRQAFRVALRVEHISNGGLREANPGLDSIGLSFAFGNGRER